MSMDSGPWALEQSVIVLNNHHTRSTNPLIWTSKGWRVWSLAVLPPHAFKVDVSLGQLIHPCPAWQSHMSCGFSSIPGCMVPSSDGSCGMCVWKRVSSFPSAPFPQTAEVLGWGVHYLACWENLCTHLWTSTIDQTTSQLNPHHHSCLPDRFSLEKCCRKEYYIKAAIHAFKSHTAPSRTEENLWLMCDC